jgi:hypothetical protein
VKQFLNQLHQYGYRQVANFSPDLSLYSHFGDFKNFYFSGFLPVTIITIYAKRQ